MQVDVNVLIPVGTFILCLVWFLAVVYFEYSSTPEQ